MKPTFALDLTRDTIALLHRTPKGWLPIGEVAFDAPDLNEALDYLRKTALGLSPMGMATKIVLPASQVLYTEIHAPGPSRDEKRRQIAAGLEGRTPYAVEDLVFDWSGKGATVKVAVVARETLDEAEGFAVTHRLNPVSYVAIPEEGTFTGEAWFGPTAAAATIIAAGETVERDRDAVVILQRDLPVADPVVASAPEVAPDPALPLLEADLASDPSAEDPLPGLTEALNADLPDPVAAVPSADDPASFAAVFADAADPLPDAPPPPPPLSAELEDSLSAALAAAAEDEALPAADSVPIAAPDARTAPEVDEAPFAHVTDTSAFPNGDDDLPAPLPGQTSPGQPLPSQPLPGQTKPDALVDDIPPAPSSAAMVAFASRRAGSAPASTRPVEGASRADVTAPPAAAAKLGVPVARAPASKGFAGLVTAPSIPGTRAKPKVKPPISDAARSPGQAPNGVRSPARPGGTFGTAAPPRSRLGVVFMVLVALLLLCLALIAAWSSFYLARNSSDGAATTEVALDSVLVEPVPGVDDEMLADMQDPEGQTGPIPEAAGADLAGADAGALATEGVDLTGSDPDPAAINLAEDEATDLPAGTLADAAPEPEPEPQVLAEPAPDPALTTDLAVVPPPVEDQDEIFLSSMEAPPPALDALALPTPAAVQDAAPEAPMPPPAFGTVYQFDARGLLVPTPEGILSPDGVLLIAGPPPLVPPVRSDVAAAAALAAASVAAPAPEVAPTVDGASSPADASLVTGGTAVPGLDPLAEPVPSDPAMAGFRPRPRPEGLAPVPEPEDDASLASDAAATAVATLRPLPRPASVLAAASASRPAEDVAGLKTADLGAQAASLTAQAEAQLAAAAALEAENPSIVAISMRPAARPRDLSRAVEAAVAAAVRAPEPEAEVIETAAAPPADLKPEEQDELDEPDVARAAPSIPTKASVAKQATFANAINLSKINLIGTYGSDSRRYALVRQSNGRYKKVKVGDRIDGGTVQAITETEVRYQKGGKLLSLKMPKA